MGRLYQHITTTEMEQFCASNDVDVLHIGQISKLKSAFKCLHCVFKINDEKIESPDFWPENFTVSIFYLNNTAREWLSCVDQK